MKKGDYVFQMVCHAYPTKQENKMLEWLQSNGDSFFLNLFYDLFKYIIGYLIAQWLYQDIYKQNKYGGWVIELVNDEGNTVSRTITPVWAERILKDDYDFSLYVKSFVSPYTRLNMDISSAEAKDIGLVSIDATTRRIFIDRSKNPG